MHWSRSNKLLYLVSRYWRPMSTDSNSYIVRRTNEDDAMPISSVGSRDLRHQFHFSNITFLIIVSKLILSLVQERSAASLPVFPTFTDVFWKLELSTESYYFAISLPFWFCVKSILAHFKISVLKPPKLLQMVVFDLFELTEIHFMKNCQIWSHYVRCSISVRSKPKIGRWSSIINR